MGPDADMVKPRWNVDRHPPQRVDVEEVGPTEEECVSAQRKTAPEALERLMAPHVPILLHQMGRRILKAGENPLVCTPDRVG